MSKKRKGRRIDHVWQLVKYKGDMSIYAKCSCGYRYECSKVLNTDGSFKTVVDENKIFHYCPVCGARKKWYSRDVLMVNHFMWE